jgi:hypothetical protein
MIPYKFIPPKDNDIDFNEEIDRMIEERLELRFTEDDILHQNLFDMPDEDADDLVDINIG